MRPHRDDDYPWLAALESAFFGEPIPAERLRRWDRLFNEEPGGLLERMVEPGRAAGRLRVGTYLPPRHGALWVITEPGHRGQGLGRSLYRALEDRARSLGLAGLQTQVRTDDPDSRSFAERRGFQHVRTRVRQELDLAPPIPEAPLPEGFHLALLHEVDSPGFRHDLYALIHEAEQDIPVLEADTPRPDFDSWVDAFFDSEIHPPHVTWLAMREGRVAGAVVYDGPLEPGGPASLDFTGVLREWRGRGLARALKTESHRVLRGMGMTRINTENDPDNPAVMALNRSLGFQPCGGVHFLRKAL